MKYLRRYLSLLVCLALSLTAFCLPVSAESAVDFQVYLFGGIYRFNASGGGEKTAYLTTANGSSQTIEARTSESYVLDSSKYYYTTYITVSNSDGSNMISSGSSMTLTVDNLHVAYSILGETGERVAYTPNITYYVIRYADGTDSAQLTDGLTFTYSSSKNTNMYKLDIKPEKDVQKVTFYGVFSPDRDPGFQAMDGQSCVLWLYYGGNVSYPLSISLVQNDETTGLLDSIIGWIKDVVQAIKALPGKIWDAIETGLKNLFVPDEEYIAGYKDRWTDLLSDRLGAVWQVTQTLFESWDRIQDADAQNSIDMPVVTIPLPGNSSFSFGGYSVPIVPDGFEWLAETLKGAVGIVCSISFIDGLRKRYDEVMGVEK